MDQPHEKSQRSSCLARLGWRGGPARLPDEHQVLTDFKNKHTTLKCRISDTPVIKHDFSGKSNSEDAQRRQLAVMACVAFNNDEKRRE